MSISVDAYMLYMKAKQRREAIPSYLFAMAGLKQLIRKYGDKVLVGDVNHCYKGLYLTGRSGPDGVLLLSTFEKNHEVVPPVPMIWVRKRSTYVFPAKVQVSPFRVLLELMRGRYKRDLHFLYFGTGLSCSVLQGGYVDIPPGGLYD